MLILTSTVQTVEYFKLAGAYLIEKGELVVVIIDYRRRIDFDVISMFNDM